MIMIKANAFYVPGTVLGTLHVLTYLILIFALYGWFCIILILQMKKTEAQMVKWLAQDYKALPMAVQVTALRNTVSKAERSEETHSCPMGGSCICEHWYLPCREGGGGSLGIESDGEIPDYFVLNLWLTLEACVYHCLAHARPR